jgi:predicted O-methyltransferase YrrM
MEGQLRRLAARLYEESRARDQGLSDRLERFRNVEPPTAELLGVLIRTVGARGVFEMGTSNGYSTIWLADAARVNGGRVVSVAVDAARSRSVLG